MRKDDIIFLNHLETLMRFIDFFLAKTSTFLYGPYKRFTYTGV